ncbi:unnamed protein product [Cyclocybe aegerita]|uniref:F-box domain-containing protein n=1 Tax=Cyclocybe aegerita TaxID=1973307 RepID=A0A8S0X2D4_CYCAE|nr:unnamed protein product [Cyclocybe aegerita]
MVCRAWRNVIRATPQMWTSIAVNMERSDTGYPEFINSQFLRSGGLPLLVEVFSYPPPYRSLENPPVMRLFKIVNAHSNRWNCLETCLHPGILQYLHGNPETHTSLLEHILVKRYGSSSAYHVQDEFGMLNSNPSPTTVHLGDLSFGSIRISWHRVTHVEISSLSFDLDSYLALFASAQVMTHLTVQKLWFPHDALTSTPVVPIEHTTLRALKIYECGLALNPLLRALKLPCLEEIFIDYDYFAPLTDLITRSNCHLKRLTLAMSRNSNMPEDTKIDLLRLLEHTPSLVALMIQDFRHTNLLVDCLEPHSQGGSPTFPDAFTHEPELLPLLHTLVIRMSHGLEWHSTCIPNWVPAPVVEL